MREVERLDWLRALELLYGERVAFEVHLYTWTAKVLVQCMVHQRAGLQRTLVTDAVTLRASAIAVMPSAVYVPEPSQLRPHNWLLDRLICEVNTQ